MLLLGVEELFGEQRDVGVVPVILAQAADELLDTDWIRAFMEQERSRYLPAVVPQ